MTQYSLHLKMFPCLDIKPLFDFSLIPPLVGAFLEIDKPIPKHRPHYIIVTFWIPFLTLDQKPSFTANMPHEHPSHFDIDSNQTLTRRQAFTRPPSVFRLSPLLFVLFYLGLDGGVMGIVLLILRSGAGTGACPAGRHAD